MIVERCFMHEDRWANHDLLETKGKHIWACDECFERFTACQPVCKHCGVYVVSVTNPDAKYKQYPHARDCPRYVKRNHKRIGT